MPYRAERISGRCRSAGHPAPPSKQPPGQGAPYVSEGNVKIHNRQDGKLITSFKPYEIKSFALKLKNTADISKQKNIKISLPFDKNIISKQNETADFEYSVAYEIMPNEINSNGFKFSIEKDGKNALVANSQKIKIENDGEIAFLCASLGKDKECEFIVDGKKIKVKINSCFERFARWDLYDFGETAYIKDGKIAFEATHCHKDGKDEIAKSMYFYIAKFDVSKNSTVILPKDKDIVIISSCMILGPSASLATPVYDEVENNRAFTFSMNKKEKLNYVLGKCVWNFTDKDEFIKANNRGKE